MKNTIGSVLRAVGFVGLCAGGYGAFVLTFSGGFNMAKPSWAAFLGGLLCIFIGDSLKKSAGALKQPVSGELADPGARFAATMIDALPLIVAQLLTKQQRVSQAVGIAILVAQFVYVGVMWVMVTKSGQTIGKKLQRIRIVKMDTGENGGFFTNVFKRSILNSILSIIPLYIIIDCLFIFRKDRRCVHDFMAGTQVVNC